MERPVHNVIAEPSQRLTTARMVSIGFVALLHVLFVYALITGLAQRFVKALPHEITAQVLPQPQQKVETPPPQAVNLQQPSMPTVQPPLVQVQTPQAPRSITTVVSPTPTPPAPTPPAVVQPPAPTPASGIVSTHTTPPYPEEARRLGQQGKVVLKMDITAAGTVADASIVDSSGSQALDQAAVDWVTKHWKYKPATQNGQPVPTTQEAAVVFDLRQAG